MIELQADELKSFLKRAYKRNIELQKAGKKPVSYGIESEAGIGKTSICMQVADELDVSCVKVNLAQLEEIGDLVGFPIKEYEVCDEEGNNCKWVDEIAYDAHVKAGLHATGKTRMGYAPPEWIAGLKKGGILILDDWTRADMRFIQACMELIDRQTYISWSLPEAWTIVLTSNPSDDADYIVTSIDKAQRTRYQQLKLKFDKKSWAEWAEGKIDGRCINFVLMHPEIVEKGVNPRTLEMFFNQISMFDNFNDSEVLADIQIIGEGSIGSSAATLFVKFIHNKLDKLIPAEDIFRIHKDTFVENLKKVVGEGEKYRADIAAVMGIRIANYISKFSNSNPIQEKHIDAIESLVGSSVLGEDNNYNIVKTVIKHNGSKFAALVSRPVLMKHMAK